MDPDHPLNPIVTSNDEGNSSEDELECHSHEDVDLLEEEEELLHEHRPPPSSRGKIDQISQGGSTLEYEENTDDAFYDENADQEDEVYVDKLRSQGLVKKPSPSDAVLSCPCCFLTVCLDCQKHEFYPDQFRAMFVMNIKVSWDQRMVFDGKKNGLVDLPSTGATPGSSEITTSSPPQIPPDTSQIEDVYYKVRCISCDTQVAALDMRDEVYHFYGCLASA